MSNNIHTAAVPSHATIPQIGPLQSSFVPPLFRAGTSTPTQPSTLATHVIAYALRQSTDVDLHGLVRGLALVFPPSWGVSVENVVSVVGVVHGSPSDTTDVEFMVEWSSGVAAGSLWWNCYLPLLVYGASNQLTAFVVLCCCKVIHAIAGDYGG